MGAHASVHMSGHQPSPIERFSRREVLPTPPRRESEEREISEQPALPNSGIQDMTEMQVGIIADLHEELYEEFDKKCAITCADIICADMFCCCDKINSFCETDLKKMTSELCKAREKGWKAFFHIILSLLIPDIVRETWVLLELITVIIGLALSIKSFTLEHNRAYYIFNFALICVSSLLALFNGVVDLKACKSCKACCFKRHPEEGDNEKKLRRGAIDTVHMIVSQVLIYPILMCNIFSVVSGRGYEGETSLDRFSFTLFIVSCLSLLLYNYLIKSIALVGILRNVTKVRTPSKVLLDNARDKKYYDPSIQSSAFFYLLYFVIHAISQMVTELLMIVAIGAKIEHEYHGFQNELILNSSDINESETLCCSGHLWYMMAWGYVSQILGILTFFIVTYYWTQEFSIGLFIDLIAIGRMKGKDYFFKQRGRINFDQDKADRVLSVFDKMYSDFKILHDKSFFKKLTYAFKSPGLIFLCICYVVLQTTFFVCAAVTYNEMGTLVVHILNGGGWLLHYLLACGIAVLANLYVLLVVVLWIIIINIILIVISIILIVIAIPIASIVAILYFFIVRLKMY